MSDFHFDSSYSRWYDGRSRHAFVYHFIELQLFAKSACLWVSKRLRNH